MNKEPIFHSDPESRADARRMRDEHWRFADLVAEYGTVWFCWWDKARRHDRESRPADVYVTCLITGVEILNWLESHEDWWIIGEWDDVRYAAPVSLTPAGKAALKKRDQYDMEPVDYGFVEPGHRAIPAERS